MNFTLLFNTWLSLGMYHFSTIPYTPPGSYKMTVLHIATPEVYSALSTMKQHLHEAKITFKQLRNPLKEQMSDLIPPQIDYCTQNINSIESLIAYSRYLSAHSTYDHDHIWNQPDKVKRQAPFGFMGWVSKKLFGTATMDDLAEIVKTVKGSLVEQFTRQAIMINYMNITSQKISHHSERLIHLALDMKKMSENLENINQQEEMNQKFAYFMTMFPKIRQSSLEFYQLFSLVRDLFLKAPGELIQREISDLIFQHLNSTIIFPDFSQISTARLHSLYWDTQDIIINFLYRPILIDSTHSGSSLLRFQRTFVHTGRISMTLPKTITNLVIENTNRYIGSLDPACSHPHSTYWELQTCPIIPPTHQLVSCISEIINSQTATKCPLEKEPNYWNIQQMIDGKWLINTEQVQCTGVEGIVKDSVILVAPKSIQTCLVNDITYTIQPHPTPTSILQVVPYVFLLKNFSDWEDLQIYNPHVAAYQMGKFVKSLKKQTENWTLVDKMDSLELTNYLQLAAKSLEEGKKHLDQIAWDKYHISGWNNFMDTIAPILGVAAFVGFYGTLFFLCLRRQVMGLPIESIAIRQQEIAILSADWIIIILLIMLFLVKIYKVLWKPNPYKFRTALLAAVNTKELQGGSYVLLKVGTHAMNGQPMSYNIILGMTHSTTIVLRDLEYLKDEVVLNYGKRKFFGVLVKHWLEINHGGLYKEGTGIWNPTYACVVPIPRSVKIQDTAVFVPLCLTVVAAI